MAVLDHHYILVDRVLRDQQILLNQTTSSSTYLEALAPRTLLTQDMGISKMERSQLSRGHRPALYRRSFCFLVTRSCQSCLRGVLASAIDPGDVALRIGEF